MNRQENAKPDLRRLVCVDSDNRLLISLSGICELQGIATIDAGSGNHRCSQLAKR